jgi:hypothetical protein
METGASSTTSGPAGGGHIIHGQPKDNRQQVAEKECF